MTQAIDLTGQTFGRLTVLRFDGVVKGRRVWRCVCTCGTEKTIAGINMTRGLSTSCGCYRKEVIATLKRTHGHSRRGSGTYNSWHAMIQRCTNPNNDKYEYYGGRGIKVCDRWLDSFKSFLEDMGERPDNTTIDRRNANGNYEPGNCSWATQAQQVANQRNSPWYTIEL